MTGSFEYAQRNSERFLVIPYPTTPFVYRGGGNTDLEVGEGSLTFLLKSPESSDGIFRAMSYEERNKFVRRGYWFSPVQLERMDQRLYVEGALCEIRKEAPRFGPYSLRRCVPTPNFFMPENWPQIASLIAEYLQNVPEIS